MPTKNLRTLHNRIVGRLERFSRRALTQMVREYRQALEEIREDLRKAYDKYAADGVLTHAEMTKYNRLQALERNIASNLGRAMSKSKRTVDRLAAATYEASFYRYGWAIGQAAEVQLNWGVIRTETVREAVRNPMAELAKRQLSQRSLQAVKRTLTQGLIRGSSYHRMSRNMRDTLNASLRDAQRIARTEGAKATTLGSQRAYDAAEDRGVETRRIWDATLDTRTRPAHATIDGTAATNRGADRNPDFRWYLAGEWVAGPAQHSDPGQSINCRCAIRPEIAGLEPAVKEKRDEESQKYERFSEWAKRNGIQRNKYGQKYSF